MHYSSEQNVSRTLISLARLRLIKYGRFWLLSGRREVGAEIHVRELPENTGDLATLFCAFFLLTHNRLMGCLSSMVNHIAVTALCSLLLAKNT